MNFTLRKKWFHCKGKANLPYTEACLRQKPVGQSKLTFTERWLHCRGRLQFVNDPYRQVPLVGAGCSRQVAALHSDHY